MSKSKIEWTDAVWNPVTGCSKVSDGCRNCYAERLWPRLKAMGNPVYKDRNFNDVQCHPERLDEPLKWMKPRRIFVNSMSDLFHDQVPDEFIARAWWVMGQCAGFLDPTRYRGHTFMILTKRPERMKSWLEGWRDLETRKRWIESFGEVFDWMSGPKYWPDVLPNVWLGVSVENQATADERIPLLLETPAAVRFISAEPLLGSVDLTSLWKVCPECGSWEIYKPRNDTPYCDDCGAEDIVSRVGLDWVIVGGESGPGARPMHPDWVRSLRDQCQTAGTNFFFKQWGEWEPTSIITQSILTAGIRSGIFRYVDIDGKIASHSMINDCLMQKVGKKKAGRLIDGRTWDELPEVQS